MEIDQIGTDRDAKDINIKDVQVEQPAASVPPAPRQSKKRAIIETLILCVALFFPLFLATLDTSMVFLVFSLICSNRRYCSTTLFSALECCLPV